MFFEVKIQWVNGRFEVMIWRGIMCLCAIPKSNLVNMGVERVISTLKPYGITKDEATLVYNKINGGN